MTYYINKQEYKIQPIQPIQQFGKINTLCLYSDQRWNDERRQSEMIWSHVMWCNPVIICSSFDLRIVKCSVTLSTPSLLPTVFEIVVSWEANMHSLFLSVDSKVFLHFPQLFSSQQWLYIYISLQFCLHPGTCKIFFHHSNELYPSPCVAVP